jgi:hypothetical protein
VVLSSQSVLPTLRTSSIASHCSLASCFGVSVHVPPIERGCVGVGRGRGCFVFLGELEASLEAFDKSGGVLLWVCRGEGA